MTQTVQVKMLKVKPGIVIDDRYKIVSELGSGGMGHLYRATDIELDRTVAIKFIFDESNEEARSRFRREALALSRIVHKNVIRVYSFGFWHELHPYIVMELLSGRSLHDLLEDEGVVPTKEALRIANEIATGLSACHAHGIIHRDMKSSNIIITDDGTAKIIDFGLCKVQSGVSSNIELQSITQEGITVGSAHCMSPEQCLSQPADGRSDIYSLGIILFQMVTGEMPFRGDSLPVLMLQQVSQPPPLLEQEYPLLAFAHELDSILQKCLQKQQSDRFNSAGELAERIAELHKSVVVQGLSPIKKRSIKLEKEPILIFSALLIPLVSALFALCVYGKFCSSRHDGSSAENASNLTENFENDELRLPYGQFLDKMRERLRAKEPVDLRWCKNMDALVSQRIPLIKQESADDSKPVFEFCEEGLLVAGEAYSILGDTTDSNARFEQAIALEHQYSIPRTENVTRYIDCLIKRGDVASAQSAVDREIAFLRKRPISSTYYFARVRNAVDRLHLKWPHDLEHIKAD